MSLISVVPKSTWMDTGFTPREGKPVEINALWVNALMEAEAMGIRTSAGHEAAREEFQRFWNQNEQCLYDCIDPFDPSVRPNQVIAIALGLVNPDQRYSGSHHGEHFPFNAVRTSHPFEDRPQIPGTVYRRQQLS